MTQKLFSLLFFLCTQAWAGEDPVNSDTARNPYAVPSAAASEAIPSAPPMSPTADSIVLGGFGTRPSSVGKCYSQEQFRTQSLGARVLHVQTGPRQQITGTIPHRSTGAPYSTYSQRRPPLHAGGRAPTAERAYPATVTAGITPQIIFEHPHQHQMTLSQTPAQRPMQGPTGAPAAAHPQQNKAQQEVRSATTVSVTTVHQEPPRRHRNPTYYDPYVVPYGYGPYGPTYGPTVVVVDTNSPAAVPSGAPTAGNDCCCCFNPCGFEHCALPTCNLDFCAPVGHCLTQCPGTVCNALGVCINGVGACLGATGNCCGAVAQCLCNEALCNCLGCFFQALCNPELCQVIGMIVCCPCYTLALCAGGN